MKTDYVELAITIVLTAAVVTSCDEHLTPRPVVNEELTPLASRYGPKHHSTNAEEWVIRDFFKDRRGGTFVDVGAYEQERFSNTYYLETELGWSGLAIEPQRQFEKDWKVHRPRSAFLPFFISDRSNEEAHLFYTTRNLSVTSARKDHADKWSRGHDTGEIVSQTITLNDLLEHERMAHFDFLTMDIELSEPKALAGFDIERYRPELVCIEAEVSVRQQILEYFRQHNYTLIGDYLRAEPFNLYFRPIQ